MSDRKKLKAIFEQLLKMCEERQCDICGHSHLEYPYCQSAYYADTILADGWIKPPCKVGEMILKDEVKCSEQLSPLEGDGDGKFYGVNIDELAIKIRSALCVMARSRVARSDFKATIEIMPSTYDTSLEIIVRC